MPNYVPYLVLVAISLTSIAWLLVQQRAWWPLLLTLAFSGMIYCFEYVIYVLFDSYRYFPHFVEKAYYDSTYGAIVSNLLAVPVAATYVAMFRLNWMWRLGFAVGFGGIEWLFLRLGVFEAHWWKIVYTILALIFFFWFAGKWLEHLRRRRPVYAFVTLQMYAWSVSGTFVFVLAVTGVRAFRSGVFEDPYHDDIFVSALLAFGKATLLAWVVYSTRSPWWKAAALLAIAGTNGALISAGVLRVYLPLWQYWLIYALCCIASLSLIALAMRTLHKQRFTPE